MEPIKYKRLNAGVEVLTILVLIIFFTAAGFNKEDEIVLLAVLIFMYLLLTGISWYSNSPAVLLKPVKEPDLYGEKNNISDDEKLYHLNRSIFFSGLFKLIILLLPVFIIVLPEIHGVVLFIFLSLIIFLNISAALIIMTFSVRSLLYAHGFKSLTFRYVFLKGVFYFNPDNKNSVVDKPFGFGQTINLANREGRLILYLLLGFPLLMMIIILILVNAAQ